MIASIFECTLVILLLLVLLSSHPLLLTPAFEVFLFFTLATFVASAFLLTRLTSGLYEYDRVYRLSNQP